MVSISISQLNIQTVEVTKFDIRYFVIVLGIFIPVDTWLLLFNGMPSGSAHEPTSLVLSLILSSVMLCFFPFIRSWHFNNDPLEPASVVGGILFLYIPLNAFGLTYMEVTSTYPSFRREVDRMLYPLTLGLIVLNIGIIFMYIGYYLFLNTDQDVESHTQVSDKKYSAPLVFMGWLIGILFYTLFQTGAVTGNAFVLFISLWVFYAPAVALIGHFRFSEVIWTYLFVLLILGNVIVVGVFFFKLFYIIYQLLLLTVVYHYVGNSINHRQIVYAGLLSMIVLSSEVLIQQIILGKSVSASPIENLVRRPIGVTSMTAVVDKVPSQIPYAKGHSILLAIYSFIPRFLWLDKPLVDLPNAYVTPLFAEKVRSIQGGSRFTLAAEFYWNLGSLGVFLGMFVYGASMAVAYSWFKNRNKTVLTLLIYGIAFAHLIEFEGSVGDTYTDMIKEFIFLFFFIFLIAYGTRIITTLSSLAPSQLAFDR